MAHCTQGMLAVLAAVFMGVLGRPKQCSLSVAPDDGFAHVLPGSDVSFVCSATCLGALSRDQLIWKDPSGKRVPAVGGNRVQAVSYNRWAVSRLVVSAARPADSGVYTCQIQHQHRLLQYTALLQVQDTRRDDPGPRRGDIFIQPEPDLGHIRPVRSAPALLPPSPHGNHTATWPVKHHDHDGESESELEKEDSEEDGQAVGGGRVRVRRKVNDTITPESTTPPSTGNLSDLTTGPAENETVDDNSTQGEITVAQSEDATHAQPKKIQPEKTTPTKTAMMPTADKSTNDMVTASTKPSLLTNTPSATTSTTLTATPTTTHTSTTLGTEAKAGDDAAGDDDIIEANGKAASTQDGGGGGESDFGRYGKLAFGLAMGAVVLLLYVLALVILVPRCRQRSHSHTLDTPSRHVTNGKESDVILMGERPHNPLALMTSATGLNGEYITAVDLDNNAGGDGEKEGEREEGDKDAAKKEDEETKGQESFVSSFLIGRLSSSKPTDADTPPDVSTARADDDNVFVSSPGSDGQTTTDDAGEKQTTSDVTADTKDGTTLTPPVEESDSKGGNSLAIGSGSDGILLSDLQMSMEGEGGVSSKPTDV